MKALKLFDECLGKVLRFISAVLLAIVFVLYIYTIILRFLKGAMPFLPIIHAQSEISELCLVWGIFLASAEVARTQGHVVVDFIITATAGKFSGKVLSLISHITTLIFSIAMIWGSFTMIGKMTARATYMPFGKKYFYMCIPICFILMAIYGVRDILQDFVSFGKKAEEK